MTAIAATSPAPPPPTLRAPRLSRDGAAPSEAALRRAAQEFETQAIGLLLQPVFATADPSGGSFGGGAAEAQWRPMLVEAYAAAAVRAGGFGIAETVHRELARQAARSTQPAAGAGATGSSPP